jgi:hypothetical protein
LIVNSLIIKDYRQELGLNTTKAEGESRPQSHAPQHKWECRAGRYLSNHEDRPDLNKEKASEPSAYDMCEGKRSKNNESFTKHMLIPKGIHVRDLQ